MCLRRTARLDSLCRWLLLLLPLFFLCERAGGAELLRPCDVDAAAARLELLEVRVQEAAAARAAEEAAALAAVSPASHDDGSGGAATEVASSADPALQAGYTPVLRLAPEPLHVIAAPPTAPPTAPAYGGGSRPGTSGSVGAATAATTPGAAAVPPPAALKGKLISDEQRAAMEKAHARALKKALREAKEVRCRVRV